MRVLVGVGTVSGATVMTVTSLVRQSVTRELPAKHQMEEEEGRKVSLRQEGWCLIKDALTPGQVAESLGSFKKGVEAGTSFFLYLFPGQLGRIRQGFWYMLW